MKKPDGNNALACGDRSTAKKVSDGATAALAEFKNPYGTVSGSKLAVFSAAAMTSCSATTQGRTTIVDDGSTFTITTCKSDDNKDLMTSKGTIE